MKRNLWIMYAIALLQGMVFYGPIATLYRQAHGLTIFQITLIESISLSLLILLEIPWGIIADKIGCRHTIIVCSVLYLISKIVFWKADGFAGFLTVISYGGAAFLSLFLTDVRIHSVKKTDTEPFRVTIKKAMKNRSLLLFLIAARTFGILFLLCHRTAGNLQLPSAFLQHGSRFLPYPGSDQSGFSVCGGYPGPQIQQYFVPTSPDRNPKPADTNRQPRHCS